MISIRVDGNNQIGLGHINRCVSIAQGLRYFGEQVIFILSDDYSKDYIADMGFEAIVLGIDYRQIDEDIDIVSKFIIQYEISLILVDSYFASNSYLEKLSNYTKVACIDGLYKYTVPEIMIINYNVAATNGYYDKLIFKNDKKLIGLDYVPLKESYWEFEETNLKTQIKKVLMTVGATDKLKVCDTLLESISKTKQFEKIDFDVVIGRFFPDKELFLNRWRGYNNIQLIVDCTDLSPYMKNVDIAISAAGTTVYELLRYNVPSILFAMVDNQLSAEALNQYTLWIGDIRKNESLDKSKINEIKSILLELIDNAHKYKEVVNRCTDIVDGRGALRIAREIIQFGKA